MNLLNESEVQKAESSSLNLSYRGVMRFLPLIVVGGFFCFTILLFAFGPIDWQLHNPFEVYSFLILCVLALSGGYMLSVYLKPKKVICEKQFEINKLLIIGAIVFILLYIPTLICTTGKWYPDLITGFTDTGAAYKNTKYYNENGNQFILYVRMILSPLMIGVMPITIYFMPKLSKLGKVLGIVVIMLTVSISICQGINKAVADFTAQMVLMLIILFFANNVKAKRKGLYKLKIFLLIILVCASFIFYFTNGMNHRIANDISNTNPSKVTSDEITRQMSQYSTFGLGKSKDNYFIKKILPSKASSTLTFLTSYLSHGYKGMSLSMNEEFTSTYGLGFSDFFRHNFVKITHQDESSIVSQTYYGKTVKYGWKTGSVWSSFFVYPASDISFPGTILLVFLIGYLFGKSFRDAIETHNPFALTAFFGFSTMIFYFSANNQMFQNGENFIGFIAILILWALSNMSLKNDKVHFNLFCKRKTA